MPLSAKRLAPRVVAALLAASPLAAQENPPMVPTELAMVGASMFAGLFDARPAFTIGNVPKKWPASLVFGKPATVVGGVAIGPVQTVVVTIPRSLDPATYLASLAKEPAWHEPPPMELPGGSFSSVGLGGRSGPEPKVLCTDSIQLSMTVSDSTPAARTLMLATMNYRAMGGGMNGLCNPPKRGPMGYGMALTIPTMRPPRGVMARGGGSHSGGDSFGASVELDRTMGADSIAIHYAAELKRGGWMIGKEQYGSENSALWEVSTRDKDGVEWRGALIVLSMPDRRELTIQMMRIR